MSRKKIEEVNKKRNYTYRMMPWLHMAAKKKAADKGMSLVKYTEELYLKDLGVINP